MADLQQARLHRAVERNRLEAACHGAGWIRSRRLQCLGFDWSILSNDSALVDHVTDLYEACVDGGQERARHVFILRRHTKSEPASVSVYRDDRAILRRAATDLAIAHVVWHVNRGVVEAADNQLLLHAAGAERDGDVVLLAGPEGSGKSTLVAALVRSGLRYVTDETVAVEVPAATITPYPKPIALDCNALDALGCQLSFENTSEQWLIPAQEIHPDAVAQPGGTARLLVFPSYRPGHHTAVRSLARAEAAVALARQAFNFQALGPGRLDAIAEVVRTCDCYELTVGDLNAGCRLVLDLFERSGTR